jgi:hypothetical protein
VQGWNRIARVASDQQNFSLRESARLFALLNIALADAHIAHFDTCYRLHAIAVKPAGKVWLTERS